MSLIQTEQHGDIAVILIDYPPVNAMGLGVPRAIIDALSAANADHATRAIVLAGAGRGIIAGADIKRQGQPWPDGEPSLRDAIAALDASAKPVVACLQGATLGGGLELVMACNYRVAGPAAQAGQPEVKLGIPPGAGGTQRLPRLIGVAAALELILSGDPVAAVRAQELGIVDALAREPVLPWTIAYAAERAEAGAGYPRARERAARLDDPALFDAARQRVARRAPGQRAPLACIECVEAAVRLPFDEGIRFERERFDECVTSDEAAALRHQFFAERAARKIPGIGKDVEARSVKRAAVVGAGTMGGGIAMCFANAGIAVEVIETDDAALARGLQRVRDNYQRSVKSGRLEAAEVTRRLALINGGTDLGAASEAEVVIEAVFEEMDIKRQLFARLDAVCRADAIIATNTSYLDVNAIADCLPARKGFVLGTHFFSPANVMRLLEVVRARDTSPQTLASAMALGQRLGKLAIVAGVCHGFIGNRMFEHYRRESDFLLEEGATPAQVDAALTAFGMAMGPLAVADLAGVDISWRKRKSIAHLRDPARRDSDIIDRLCERERFGQKTGAGYYRYEKGNRTPQEDPAVLELIREAAREKGIAQREINDREIVQRCLYPLINEGARILEEGIALRASDIDLVYTNGYGFPRWRGGPMFWGERLGLDKVLASIEEYAKQHDFWEPAPLLKRLAAEGRSFGDHDRG